MNLSFAIVGIIILVIISTLVVRESDDAVCHAENCTGFSA